jgi:hypothetical protein
MSAILSRLASVPRFAPSTKAEATEIIRRARKDGLSLPPGRQPELAAQLLERAAEIRRVRAQRPRPASTGSSLAQRFASWKRCREEYRRELSMASSFSSMMPASEGRFRLGEILIQVRQTCDEDWDRYSKGWHRAHGPARTYSTSITVSQWTPRGVRTKHYPQSGLRHIDRRAVEAVADFLGLPKLRGKVGLRIDPHVELVEVPSPRRHVTVFERRLSSERLGYVAVRRDSHYHASTIAGVVDGLMEKLVQARLSTSQRLAGLEIGLDLDRPIGAILRGLKFCSEGTADAIDMLGLDDKVYTLQELLAAGNWRRVPAVAAKYPKECAVIAAALAGIKLPEGTELTRVVRQLVG